jgi:hypothetical protein
LAQSFYIGPKYIPNGPQSLPNWTPIPSKWTQTIPPDPRSLATWIRNRQSLTPSWGFLITGGDNKFTVPCVSNLWVGRLRGNGLGRWATAGCNWAKLLALNKQQSCPLVHIHCRSMRRPLLGVLEVVEKCCLPPQSGRGHNLFWEGSLGMWVRKKKTFWPNGIDTEGATYKARKRHPPEPTRWRPILQQNLPSTSEFQTKGTAQRLGALRNPQSHLLFQTTRRSRKLIVAIM